MKETWYNPQTFCHSKAFYVATRSWVLLFVEGHTVIYIGYMSHLVFKQYLLVLYQSRLLFDNYVPFDDPSIILVMHLFLNSISFY